MPVECQPPTQGPRDALGGFAEVREPMRFVGVDLAWGPRGGTGVCVATDGVVVDSTLVRTDEEIVDWLAPHVAGPCVVAIDAPIIVRNQTGRRGCDDLISRCFGRYEAAAHSANLTMPAFAGGPRAERLARMLDLSIDPGFPRGTPVRRAIEVYPHPAIVVLFGLARTIKYKAKAGRSVEDRRKAFQTLADAIETLRDGTPALDVTASPRWTVIREGIATVSTGAAFDRIEDELDAYVCAYVAAYLWTHGRERCRVVGDVNSGYIVTPVTGEIAACLDSAVSDHGRA